MAPRGCAERDGHSSGTPVARRLKQPTRTAGSGHRSRGFLLAPPLFDFAPGGVCRAVSVAGNAVRSYHTFSPLLPEGSGLLLCGTFPGVAPAGRYPAPCVHGARTFLPGHLSVIAGAAVQPTDGTSDGHAKPRRQGAVWVRFIPAVRNPSAEVVQEEQGPSSHYAPEQTSVPEQKHAA